MACPPLTDGRGGNTTGRWFALLRRPVALLRD